jgi:hypothetical protein
MKQGYREIPKECSEALLVFLHHQWREGCLWLTILLNRIATFSDERGGPTHTPTALLIVPEDIEKLLQDSRLYQFKVHYPEAMTAEALWQIYLRAGALSLVDIGIYLRQVRRTKRVTLSGLETKGSLSASVLSRLEAGALERVKLVDVLAFDERLGQEGKLVAMYWRACILLDMVAQVHKPEQQADKNRIAFLDQREHDLRVIELFLTICRWFSCQYGSDHTWLKEFRRRFDQVGEEARMERIEDGSEKTGIV